MHPNGFRRSPEESARPRKNDENNNVLDIPKPTVNRHIILIRHGQYRTEGKTDKERVLTELGLWYFCFHFIYN